MTLTFSKLKLYFFLIIALFCVTNNTSFAADEASKIEDVMCKGYSIFNGPLGKTFAVFAIVALGVGFFLGKVSWGTAIAIALGIGAIFGAPALVNTITGGNTTCNSSGFTNTTTNS